MLRANACVRVCVRVRVRVCLLITIPAGAVIFRLLSRDALGIGSTVAYSNTCVGNKFAILLHGLVRGLWCAGVWCTVGVRGVGGGSPYSRT